MLPETLWQAGWKPIPASRSRRRRKRNTSNVVAFQ